MRIKIDIVCINATRFVYLFRKDQNCF